MDYDGWRASQCYIHRYTFFDYDKMINFYASKNLGRMLLINPLSENLTAESFNARKTLAINIKTLTSSYLLSPVSHFDIPDIKKWKLCCEWAWEIKKMISYHLKGLHKLVCYKTKSNFSQFFSSHWLLYECFFSFLINALVNFEKFIRFYR